MAKKKYLLLLLPLLVLLSGCGTSPDQLTGPDTPGFWENINAFFSMLIVQAGLLANNNIVWGLIIVTLAVRIAMIPLYKAQIQSQVKMNVVQPEVKKIQEKYAGKSDQESKMKMNQEIQAMYKRHGVNPLAGCVPSLIQLPLLFVFYGAIENLLVYKVDGQTAIHLFTDETMSMHFLIWDNLGEPVFAIAIIAALTTYFATVVSSLGSEQAANSDMMKGMKVIMPLMILMLGFTLPGALAVYWTIGNLITIVQTLILRRDDIQRVRAKKKIEQNK